MRWLLLVNTGTDLTSVRAEVEALGGEVVSHQTPTPLGETELAVEVEAPKAFSAAVKKHPWVKGIYPSSEMQAY